MSRTIHIVLAGMAIAAVAGAGVAAALEPPASRPRAEAALSGPLPPADCVTRGAVGIPYRVGVNCRVVRVDGHPRRFVVYVPRTRPITGPRAPVVFMFHGSSGDGERFLRISGWRQQADRTGLVAVFPTGLRYRVLDNGRLSTKWHDDALASQVDLDERPDGYPETAPWPADDVGFVDAMTADLRARLPVDDRRIYASGFSNGASFTARLAVERSRRLAAAGFVAEGLSTARMPARPIPMLAAVGTRDDRVLARTGPPPLAELSLDPRTFLAEPVIASFVDAHLDTLGLDRSDLATRRRVHSTQLRWPAAGAGPGGAVFRFAMLAGLGHRYPNGSNNPAGFEAAPRLWDFFVDHPLPEESRSS